MTTPEDPGPHRAQPDRLLCPWCDAYRFREDRLMEHIAKEHPREGIEAIGMEVGY